jgi:hypothetical protein
VRMLHGDRMGFGMEEKGKEGAGWDGQMEKM